MLMVIPLMVSFLAPALTGILLALTFPNHHLDWLAWIAFLPLLLSIRKESPWRTFLMGWFGGVIFFVGTTPWWIKEFRFVNPVASGLGYLYLGFYYALFGLLLNWLSRTIRSPLLVAPPVWVALEYLRIGKPISVAVVQGNIPQKIKWNRKYRERIISKYETLKEVAAKSEPHFQADQNQFGTFICWEVLFPDLTQLRLQLRLRWR
jgi:apolipoprotein N-acyltransferase